MKIITSDFVALPNIFIIIVQVIIEMCTLWLVAMYIISHKNHLARVDNNTEALSFKIIFARVYDVLNEETSLMK